MMTSGEVMLFSGPDNPLQRYTALLPELKTGEVLIRNRFVTLCGSDLHTYSGKRTEACPTVLGHEVVGVVEQIGPGHPGTDLQGGLLTKGDLVTWSVFASDPESYYARIGMPQKGAGLFKYGHAPVTTTDVFHGGLSEYCILKPGTAILKIPPTLPLPVAATVNCALATVAGALRLAGSVAGKQVMIFGDGLLGLSCAAMCKTAGAAWVGVAGTRPRRIRQAVDFGADVAFITASGSSVWEGIREQFERSGVDVAFDMSGAPEAMEQGLRLLAVGGIAIWAGAVFKNRPVQVDAEQLVRRLITIRGLHNYNTGDLVAALDFIAANWNRYAFAGVVEREFHLSEVNEAFQYALGEKPLRVGIRLP